MNGISRVCYNADAMLLSDTTPEAEAVQIAIFRQMTPSQRLRVAIRASDFTRRLAIAAIRRQHPEWTETEAKREFLRRQFPPDQIPPPLKEP